MKRLILHNKGLPDWPMGKERSTVVLDKPEVNEIFQELRRLFTKSVMKIPVITVNIGSAFAHPKDCFNKKLGRKMAEERMKPLEFQISVGDYQNHDEAVYLVLTGIDRSLQVHYSLNVKVYRDSGDMRVMACYTRSWR